MVNSQIRLSKGFSPDAGEEGLSCCPSSTSSIAGRGKLIRHAKGLDGCGFWMVWGLTGLDGIVTANVAKMERGEIPLHDTRIRDHRERRTESVRLGGVSEVPCIS